MTRTSIPNINTLTNIILDRSVPEFVENNNPMFVAFLNAYYEWMEQSLQPLDVIKNLRNYRDVDETIDQFIQYFCDEFMASVPSTVLADKRLLLKQIQNFYKIKGTEDSYRFLFRILYDENIDFYYPQTDTMIIDGGHWIQDVTIKVDLDSISLDDLNYIFNGTLVGGTSGAKANVSSITSYTDRSESILELYLVNYKGQFQHGEYITVTPDDSNHDPLLVKEVYTGITVTDPGTKYVDGDRFNIVNGGSTIIGYGNVTQVGRGPIVSISIGAGGANYNGSLRDIDNFLYMPLYLIGTDTLYSIGSDLLNHDISPITVSDVPDQIIFTDTPSPIGYGATGHVAHVDESGAITAIQLDTHGQFYLDPVPSIVSLTGSGGVIDVVGGGGGIIQTQLTTFPVVDGGDTITVDFSPGHGTGATGTILSGGTTIKYPGYYENAADQIDTYSVLEDSYYYQQFSYVILSSISFEQWSSVVKGVLHPAGMIAFAKLRLYGKFHRGVYMGIDNNAASITV
jgi:hypothetical protein